jgi:FMN-dependent NADH-azoreductase
VRVLHIIATPRSERSNTLTVSKVLLESLAEQHGEVIVDELDVFTTELPGLGGTPTDAKYSLMSRQDLDDRQSKAWEPIEALVQRFLAADKYVVTCPMWNFGVPYALKHLIDVIVQPGRLFAYNEHGIPVGLVQDRQMVIVTSRGGDYSEASPLHALDHQVPYLRAIFGFVGITDIGVISAQPMDISLDLRTDALAAAVSSASGQNWTNQPDLVERAS